MGILIPANFDLRILNRSEKRVVEILRDRLSDSWKIIPHLEFATKKRSYEIDVLIFHEKYGVIGIEVKGEQVSLQDGTWKAGKRVLDESPSVQSRKSCRALKKKSMRPFSKL